MASEEPARVRINFYKPQVADMSFEKIQKMIEKSSAVGGKTEEEVVQQVVEMLKEKGVSASSVTTATTAEALADAILNLDSIELTTKTTYMNWYKGWMFNYPKTAINGFIAAAVLAILACLYRAYNPDISDFVGEGMELLAFWGENVSESVMNWLKGLPGMLTGVGQVTTTLQALVTVFTDNIPKPAKGKCDSSSLALSYFAAAMKTVSVAFAISFGSTLLKGFYNWFENMIKQVPKCVKKTLVTLNVGFEKSMDVIDYLSMF